LNLPETPNGDSDNGYATVHKKHRRLEVRAASPVQPTNYQKAYAKHIPQECKNQPYRFKEQPTTLTNVRYHQASSYDANGNHVDRRTYEQDTGIYPAQRTSPRQRVKYFLLNQQQLIVQT
jgi:hypothetical protein